VIGTSAYRDDAARYRALASQPPQDGLDEARWIWLCQQFAKAYDDLAARHERAIEEGTEAQFWAPVRTE
jgi:hypothetical protein